MRLKTLLLALPIFACSTVPALAANEDVIRGLIESADIVPSDYKQQINIVCKDASVLISVYKDPQAELNDCKIDAILFARKVLEAAPATKLVSVFFYDFAAPDKVVQADVPTSAVVSFANGRLSKLGVLKAVTLFDRATNTLAESFSGQTYKQIIERLGVIDGPLQHKRALALVKINELTRRGKDTSELRRRYLHIEDLTRRGNANAMKEALQALDQSLESLREPDRTTRLDGITGALPPVSNPGDSTVAQ